MMRNAFAILMVACGVVADPASALQAQLELAPIASRAGGDWTFGGRIRAAYESRTLNLEADRPWERVIDLALYAPILTHSDRNPELLSAAVAFGWEKSLMVVEGGLEVREDDPIDWGFLSFAGSAEFEAPQTFDVVSGSLAAVLEYAHREPRIFYIPTGRIALEATGCRNCRDDEGSAFFGRVDIDARLVVPFSLMADALEPVQLRLDARAFHTIGQPDDTEAMIETSALSGGVELAYRRTSASGWWEVFVRWRDGRLPVADVGTKAWTLGAAYAFL
jgi:hypothetical protein